ncbi:hypothetical protein LZC95_47675 [Pendulispora brunnea]|uniref:Uncharacterized protein n=1 Tax=Pendulispora brunnea TaxID=2905690 RepID=A0ABZ2K5Z0_9BACT
MMPYRTRYGLDDLELVPDPELLAQQRRQRLRRRLTGLGVLVGVGGLVTCALVLHDRHDRRVRLEQTWQAWDRLATCLVGTQGTFTPEQASLRVRNAQLAILGLPWNRWSESEIPVWPGRCGPLAHRLAAAARRQGSTPTLVDSSQAFAHDLSEPDDGTANLQSHVRALFAAAAAIPLAADRAHDADEAPAPASPLNVTTLPRAARMRGEWVPVSGIRPSPFYDGTLRVMVGGLLPERAACVLAHDGTEMTCSPMHTPKRSNVTSGLEVFYTSGRETHLELDPAWCLGTWLKPCPSALEDGSLAYIGDKDDSLTRVEDGCPSKSPSRRVRIAAQGDFDDVARAQEASNAPPSLGRCRANGTDVLAVGSSWGHIYLSFLGTRGWSPPVWYNGYVSQLQCAAGEAILTGVEPSFFEQRAHPLPFVDGVLREIHCTDVACTSKSMRLAERPYHSSDILPADHDSVATAYLDGKLLVVWSAGTRGGLRMRMAPIESIMSVPDTVLYDDHVRAGSFQDISTLHGFRLVPFASGALLFLETVEGTFALRIGSTGALEPLPSKIVTR